MFEFNKLPALALVLLLLAPFFILFWRFTSWNPDFRSAEAEIKQQLAEEIAAQEAPESDAFSITSTSITSTSIMSISAMRFSDSTDGWVSFYPRRWAGWLGLSATSVILFLTVLCLFSPGPNASSVSYSSEDETLNSTDEVNDPVSPDHEPEK